MTYWKASRYFQCLRFCLIIAFWLFASTQVLAVEPRYLVTVAMDQASWRIKSDRFKCKLELDLEKNGKIAFIHTAGSTGALYYFPDNQSIESVQVASTTPPWLPATQSEWVDLKPIEQAFQLSEGQTASLLNSMDAGLWTSLKANNTEIIIPTIRWRPLREHYQQCEHQLSPMSVAQAKDNVVRYVRGQTGLSEDQRKLLVRLARYSGLDPRISKVLIDGHTDNVGGRIANLQLARQRANDVAATLASAGMDKTLMEIRAHGDRYPISDNETPEGRDQNRRVTIRIIRKSGQDNS